MNTSNLILVIDVNVIIHLDKAGLLDELTKDKRTRIVDLVLYDEYQFKRNLASDMVERIETITLNDKQIIEADALHRKNTRNSFYDYCSYIVARDNNYVLLSGDWKLKNSIGYDNIHGVIWYLLDLYNNGIISSEKVKEACIIWLNDPTVYIKEDILIDLIEGLN